MKTREKIREIKASLGERESIISKKEKENVQLNDELAHCQAEVEEVLAGKNRKLGKILDNLAYADAAEYRALLVAEEYTEAQQDLLDAVADVEQVTSSEKYEYEREDFEQWFAHKDTLVDMLDDRRNVPFDAETFERLTDFVKAYTQQEFSKSSVTSLLYDFLVELHRKLNVKTTMSTLFHKIEDVKTEIDANNFATAYARGIIEQRTEDLLMQNLKHDDLRNAGLKLSRKIEEAEVSHMRTEHIFENITAYTEKLKTKRKDLDERRRTLLGDAILLATSAVLLGPFAPEERETLRAKLISHLTKIKGIECSHVWIPQAVHQLGRGTKNPRNMFTVALKDFGFKEMLKPERMPAVLSPNDLSEALFSILFAPSLPVICDPTGQFEDFIRTHFLANVGGEKISGADIFANEKVLAVLRSNRAAILTDVNCLRKQTCGLSQDLPILKRLSTTLYNGYDFNDKRTAQLKKIGALGAFHSHFASVNKRVQVFDKQLENISVFQLQVFQAKFDFQLNAEYLQNSTFVCAAPSYQTDQQLDSNPAIVQLKELFMDNLLCDTKEFELIKQNIRRLNSQMKGLEQNFQNSFLVASGETLKKLVDYHQLKKSVEDVRAAREDKERLQAKYREILGRVKLLSEVTRVIY